MLAQQDNDTQILEQIRKINERMYSLDRKMDVLADLLRPKAPENKSAPKVTKPLSPIDFYADESNQHQPNNQQQNSHQHSHQRNHQPNTQQNNHQSIRSKERTMYSAICADCRQECSLPFKPREDRPVYCKGCFARRKNPNAFKAKEEVKVEAASHVQPAAVVAREEAKPNKIKKPKAAAKLKKKPVTAKKASAKKAPAKKSKRK